MGEMQYPFEHRVTTRFGPVQMIEEDHRLYLREFRPLEMLVETAPPLKRRFPLAHTHTQCPRQTGKQLLALQAKQIDNRQLTARPRQRMCRNRHQQRLPNTGRPAKHGTMALLLDNIQNAGQPFFVPGAFVNPTCINRAGKR